MHVSFQSSTVLKFIFRLEEDVMNKNIYRVGQTTNYYQLISGCSIYRIDSNTISGVCTVHFSDGTQSTFQTVYSVFNTQYGIAVSEKFHCILIGTWERGLYCYDAYTGERRWRSPMGSNRSMYVPPHSDYVITTRAGKGLFRLDIATGLVHDSLRSTTTENSYRITDSVALVERLGRDYCLVDLEQFQIIKRYAPSKIQSPDAIAFIITDAWLEHNPTTNAYDLWIEYLEQLRTDADSPTLPRYRRPIDSFPSLEALREES